MSPHSSDIILREIAQAISTASGEEFFRRLAEALCQTLEADFAFIGRLDADDPNRIHVMAVCVRGEIGQNFSYHLHGTPCENVVGREPCHYPRDIQSLFPEDHMLVEMGIESYVGYPLFGSARQPLGLLAVMHSRPIPEEEPATSVLRICATRAAAELERMRSDQALRESKEHYHVLARLAPVGIFRTDTEGHCIYVNQQWCDIAGISPEQAYGEGWAQAIHPDDRQYIFERWYAAAKNDLPFKEECRLQRPDGYTTWVLAQAAAERGANGRATSYVGTITDITDRKQAEAEMLKLSSVVEQTADSVVITDREGVIQYVNPAHEKITGYTREEAVGKKPNIVKSGKHNNEFYERLWSTIQRGEVFRDRFINHRKDGSLFHEEKTITPLKDGQGHVTHFVSTGKDITERVLAENENRRMQAFLNSVVENLPNMLFVKDAKDLRFVRFNRAAEELLGYSRDEMLGKNDRDFFTKEEADFFTAKDREVLDSGQFHDIPEEPVHTRHKGVRLLHTQKIPILDESGKPLYLLGISEDITERKTAEDMLARLGRILDNSSNEIYVFCSDSLRFIQVNQGAQRNLGYNMEELRNFTPLDLKPGFTKRDFEALIAPLRRGEQDMVIFETVHKRKDGGLYQVEVRLQLFRNETPPVFVAIIQNITDRKKAYAALRMSEARFRSLTELSSDWYWEQDADFRFTLVTRSENNNDGRFAEEETLGKRRWELPYIDVSPAFWKAHEAQLQAHQPFRDLVLKRKDDKSNIHFVSISGVPIFDAQDRFQGYRGTGHDITERMQAMEALRESETRLANAQRIAHFGNWERNIVTNEVRWSKEVDRIFGLNPQQSDPTFAVFLNAVHPDDRQNVIDTVNKAISEKQPYRNDFRVVQPDGTERMVHSEAEITFDNNGKAVYLFGTIQDITERRQVQERLHYLAYYDSLTGLPNRQQVNDSLYRAMLEAESRDRLVAVMFLDLDRFKNINDTLGHDVGDALLKEVAVRLKASLRPGDSISRLGGDEFVLILGNIAHINDVTRVAQKILDQFIPPFRIAGRDLFASPSIGITLYPFDDNNTENLLKNADTAMYHAKSLGRNNFQFYTAELNARAARQLELETGMRRALEREEFVLHYQPLVNMQSGLIVGMEALLRWQHPEYGLIPPMEFIPLAEETGLIVPIGEWVLRTACAQIKVWHATGFPALHVAVNLSSKQLQQKNFAEVVKRALRETGLEPRYLDLELTESLLMQDMESAVAILKELKDLGALISLDDFGTGYSSLSYLKRFPIDFLKIDRSFVKDIAHDRYGAGIVRAIIVMAHTLDIKVIAEGVETAEQLEFLRAQGCDISQGYFCSKPLAVQTFTELLKDWQDIRMGKCSITKPVRKLRKKQIRHSRHPRP